MKRSTLLIALVATASVLAVAAGAQAQGTGSANFSRYVALGDSLTHGFASGGVMRGVQVNSYPALIARQAGAADFQQPTITSPGIPPLLELRALVPSPVLVPRSATPGRPDNLTLARPYNNLGVSGFKVRDVLSTVTGNGLIDTVLRGLGTPLQQALALQPTFATVWIGNNDVLGAATSGRVIEGITLTPPAQFEADYRAIVSALRARGANVVVATLPSVTSIPFVTTVPPVVVNPATRLPVLVNGQPVPLIGPNGPLALNDRVLLSASSLLAQGIGIPAALGGRGTPLPDEVVLSAAEAGAIEARRALHNAAISRAASDFGAAVVPADQIFAAISANGFPVGGGIAYTTAFLTGGIFSYDGVHPNPIGYAIVANAFLEVINSRFGGSIPAVDLFPFVFGSPGSGGATVPVTGALTAASTVYTAEAWDSVRDGLRIPSAADLARYDRPKGGGEDSGSSDGGGAAGGGGGGGGHHPEIGPAQDERPTGPRPRPE